MKNILLVICLFIIGGRSYGQDSLSAKDFHIDSMWSSMGMENKSGFVVAQTNRQGKWEIPNGDSIIAYMNAQEAEEEKRYDKLARQYNKLVSEYNRLRKMTLAYVNDVEENRKKMMEIIKPTHK